MMPLEPKNDVFLTRWMLLSSTSNIEDLSSAKNNDARLASSAAVFEGLWSGDKLLVLLEVRRRTVLNVRNPFLGMNRNRSAVTTTSPGTASTIAK